MEAVKFNWMFNSIVDSCQSLDQVMTELFKFSCQVKVCFIEDS